MKTKILASLASIIFTGYVSIAASAPPHWSYDEEPIWGAIEDAALPVPLRYPYAECGIGQHQSPVDLADAKIVSAKPLNKLHSIRQIRQPSSTRDMLYRSILPKILPGD